MTMTASERTARRALTRMDSPGVAPSAEAAADAGIGGRDSGWVVPEARDGDDFEPTIVRGRE